MNRRFDPRTLAFLGMMTALVFASNYARIIMPIAIGGRTSFTLANPAYAPECWITFLTKGVMGLVAGLLVRRQAREGELSYARCLAGAVCGCLAYYVLYFAKSFFYDGLLVEGLQPGVALAALPLKIPASVFNAAVAIIAAPPLALALQAALKRSGLTLRRA